VILQNKNAIIYGAGGSLGGAVAKAFADAGASLFLTGRNIGSVQKLADEIISRGGIAKAAEVDAMDEKAISHHLDGVVQETGKIDISFNAVGISVVQNIPLIEMGMSDFVLCPYRLPCKPDF
jgi:3-oxoacyl-[acyl-carrier protein] reductase